MINTQDIEFQIVTSKFPKIFRMNNVHFEIDLGFTTWFQYQAVDYSEFATSIDDSCL